MVELAGHAAWDNKKYDISPRHLQLAVRNDAECVFFRYIMCLKIDRDWRLLKLFTNLVDSQNGTAPHPALVGFQFLAIPQLPDCCLGTSPVEVIKGHKGRGHQPRALGHCPSSSLTHHVSFTASACTAFLDEQRTLLHLNCNLINHLKSCCGVRTRQRGSHLPPQCIPQWHTPSAHSLRSLAVKRCLEYHLPPYMAFPSLSPGARAGLVS